MTPRETGINSTKAHLSGMDSAMTSYARERESHDMMSRIRTCDVFWLLCPPTLSGGSMVELGVAIGSLKQPFIAASGPMVRHTVYTELALAINESDDVAFAEILKFKCGAR